MDYFSSMHTPYSFSYIYLVSCLLRYTDTQANNYLCACHPSLLFSGGLLLVLKSGLVCSKFTLYSENRAGHWPTVYLCHQLYAIVFFSVEIFDLFLQIEQVYAPLAACASNMLLSFKVDIQYTQS